MNEWTVITVLSVLIGLIASVLRPIISLNSNITRLNENVCALEKNIAMLNDTNSATHEKLWRRADEHEETLNDHETRLQLLESR